MLEIEAIVHQLQLLPHPEGGFYRETYRSEEIIPQNVLGNALVEIEMYALAFIFY